MNSEQWQRVRQVLDEAIALDPAERGHYLDQSCNGDHALRIEVESLLASHEQAGTGFLETPAVDLRQQPAARKRVGSRIGAYDILEEIGHGGMGEVYRAIRADGQYKKEVAIKLVRGGYDTAAVLERFLYERQILASLDHPNIARLYDGGTTEAGLPYLVMELVEGTPIDQYCAQHGLGVNERLHLFTQVCAAVHYAHQRLVIHRDIKPSNILVTEDGIPKLLDFGIAKILNPAAIGETTLVRPMTPEYASPEQVRGDPITTASDVYSLGVVLYRLLTGHSPYPESTSTPLEFARVVCEVEPAKPSSAICTSMTRQERSSPERSAPPDNVRAVCARLQRRLKGDLDNVVLKALRKEPGLRYGSVEQFAEDIRRHLQSLPVTATPESIPYRMQRFVRRHKVGVLATALLVLAVAAGITATVREARVAAANASSAERRFNDVRQLSDSMLFEVHDAIEKLPGATPARKLIVQRSLEYLNRLAQDSGQDISLQRELGNAYERIGLVQGNPDGSNLGDVTGAIDSFNKAISIREALAANRAHPDPTDLAALAASYREMCGVNARYLNRIAAALQYCNRARAIAEKVTAAAPGNRAFLQEMARIYEATGGVYGEISTVGNAGDYDLALENHRKALALVQDLEKLSPADQDLQRWDGKLSIVTGDDLFQVGSMSQALALYEKATQTFEILIAHGGNPSYNHSLAASYQRLGDMLLVDGHYAQAIPYYRKQLEVMKRAMASDPKDMATRVDVAACRATYGHALWRAGYISESLASLRQGLAELSDSQQNNSRANGLRATLLGWIAGALEKSGALDDALRDYVQSAATYAANCKSDPTDSENCLQMAGTEDRIAGIYLRQGKLKEALSHYQSGLDVTQPLFDRPKPNLEAVYTLVNLDYGIGEVYRAMALQSRAEIQMHAQACVWYGKSRDAFSRIAQWHPITPTEFDARSRNQIETRLRQCRSLRSLSSPLQGSAPVPSDQSGRPEGKVESRF